MNILQYESKIWATADLLRGPDHPQIPRQFVICDQAEILTLQRCQICRAAAVGSVTLSSARNR